MHRIWILSALSFVLGCGLLADLTGTRCNADGSCGDGLVCLEGRCEASCGELSVCGSTCVDLRSNPSSCGTCGVVCASGEACVDGACAPGAPRDGGVPGDAGSDDAGSLDGGDLDGGTNEDAGRPAIDPDGPKPICGPDGWCWENPLPQGEDLVALHAFGPDHVWAVSRLGMTLRWNGQYWTGHPLTGIDVDLYAIHGLAPDDVWAVGQNGVIAHWDGSGWSQVATFYVGLRAVWAIAPNHAIAVGDQGLVVRWDGASWTRVVDEDSVEPPWTALWGDGDGKVVAVGEGGGFAEYDYDPANPSLAGDWRPGLIAGAPDLYAITGGGGAFYAGGAAGTLLTFETAEADGWRSLPGVPATENSTIRALHLDPDGVLWAANDAGKVLRGEAAGTLTAEVASQQDRLDAVWGFGNGRALAVGRSGEQVWRDTAGTTHAWKSERKGRRLPVLDVAAGTGGAWAISGTALLRRQGEGVWEDAYTIPFPPTAVATDPSGTEVWVVGGGGRILYSADGTTFDSIDGATGGNYADVWSPASGVAIIVGSDTIGALGVIERCNGSQCEQLKPDPLTAGQLSAVWAESDEVFWAVGDQGENIRYFNGTWSRPVSWTGSLTRPERLTAIWGRSDTQLWMGGLTAAGGGILVEWSGGQFTNRSATPQSGVLSIAGNAEVVRVAGVNGSVQVSSGKGQFRKEIGTTHNTIFGLAASGDTFFIASTDGTLLSRGP